MLVETAQDDAKSDASSTTARTPATDVFESHGRNHNRSAVPWYGSTFMILEKSTPRAITLIDGRLCLQDIDDSPERANHWFCVEQDGYLGFQNPRYGRYLGHDGGHGVRATATELRAWELFTPRQHPDGGYLLQQPFWSDKLMVICVDGDGTSLVRRYHGTTLWEFVLV